MGQGRCEESILGNLKNDVDRFEIKHFSKSPDTAPISEPKYSSKGVSPVCMRSAGSDDE